LGREFFEELVRKIEVLSGRALAGTALRPTPLFLLAPRSLVPIDLRKISGSDAISTREGARYLLATKLVPQEAALSTKFVNGGVPTEQVLQQGCPRARRADDENRPLKASRSERINRHGYASPL